jgi:AbrB family looped-hinge helix DNA binding protein
MDSTLVHVGQRGTITLPKSLRETYGIRTGDALQLLDLDGLLVLSPHISQVDAVAEKLSAKVRSRGQSLATMLEALREERAKYGR